jgi:hypothetical protein
MDLLTTCLGTAWKKSTSPSVHSLDLPSFLYYANLWLLRVSTLVLVLKMNLLSSLVRFAILSLPLVSGKRVARSEPATCATITSTTTVTATATSTFVKVWSSTVILTKIATSVMIYMTTSTSIQTSISTHTETTAPSVHLTTSRPIVKIKSKSTVSATEGCLMFRGNYHTERSSRMNLLRVIIPRFPLVKMPLGGGYQLLSLVGSGHHLRPIQGVRTRIPVQLQVKLQKRLDIPRQ